VPLANIDLADTKVITDDKKVAMAQRLVMVGYDPAQVLKALNLPAISHTGVPSTQLQPVAQIDPVNPDEVYEVD
jgi:hypothetical protein